MPGLGVFSWRITRRYVLFVKVWGSSHRVQDVLELLAVNFQYVCIGDALKQLPRMPCRLGMWSFDGYGLPPIALACIDEDRLKGLCWWLMDGWHLLLPLSFLYQHVCQ